jgi:hypothetical protein
VHSGGPMKVNTVFALILALILGTASSARAGGGRPGGGTSTGGILPMGGGTGGGSSGSCGGGGGTLGETPEINAMALDTGDMGGQITTVAAHEQTHTYGEWYPWQSYLPPAWTVVEIPNYFPCAEDQVNAAATAVNDEQIAHPQGGCILIRFDYIDTFQMQMINGNMVNALIARTRVGETFSSPGVGPQSCGVNWDGL